MTESFHPRCVVYYLDPMTLDPMDLLALQVYLMLPDSGIIIRKKEVDASLVEFECLMCQRVFV